MLVSNFFELTKNILVILMIENNLFNRKIIISNINLIETIIICNTVITNSIDTFGGCYLTVSSERN